MGMRPLAWVLGWVAGAAIGGACTDAGGDSCPIGALECPCTTGNACNEGLVCLDGTCILPAEDTSGPGTSTRGDPTSAGPGTNSQTGSATGETTAALDSTTSATSGGGDIFDVSNPVDLGPVMGCQAIDMLFVIDGSGSMVEERNALAATAAFTQVIMTLEGLNMGNIAYRIGVTDDDDHGFLVPPGWFEPDPWFDSESFSAMEIATFFNQAVGQVGLLGGASVGCEHVLTSGTDLITSDLSGFVREDALLVLVLLTDVDDYGAYDQIGGNTCGAGCSTPPTPLGGLLDALVAAKDGQLEGVAAIAVAGDPNANDGLNFCEQPGSCGCVEVFPGLTDCEIFHGSRLWDFVDMLGSNGYAADLCDGPASVPTAVATALTESIEIACENFDPAG